jgi:FixJ family two-component response regulator
LNQREGIVYVVDDDPQICAALADLLSTFDLSVVSFPSATEYLRSERANLPSCLILDVELPDINGLDLQSQVGETPHPPIVFVTGHGDIPRSVRAMKAGAVDFLTKPFREEDLMRSVRAALEQDRVNRRATAELAELSGRLEQLTPREREVLSLVVSGLLNKQSAAELGISLVTLQIHRGNVMRKMRAGSLAELVRLAGKLELPMPRTRRDSL